jgi:hypothetical protein
MSAKQLQITAVLLSARILYICLKMNKEQGAVAS